MTLTVNEISRAYGSLRALDRASFSVDRGEIVGLLGPNGAGKTTAMKIIAGCLSADEGSVTACGYDMRREPLKAKRSIGYLPDDNPLYDEMYVCEYLEYAARFYSTDRIREQVVDVLALTGLQAEAHRKIGRLSKGWRQRTGLAQALVHRPELLILDEPSAGLDPNQIDGLRRLLRTLSGERAILFSSHALQEAQALCTRIVIVCGGRIALDRPASEIGNLPETFRRLTRQPV